MIIGTCGHEITIEDVDKGLRIKEYSRGEKCAAYISACPACREWYEKEGLVIHTDEEENNYLGRE